jgi:hypothetical protein
LTYSFTKFLKTVCEGTEKKDEDTEKFLTKFQQEGVCFPAKKIQPLSAGKAMVFYTGVPFS